MIPSPGFSLHIQLFLNDHFGILHLFDGQLLKSLTLCLYPLRNLENEQDYNNQKETVFKSHLEAIHNYYNKVIRTISLGNNRYLSKMDRQYISYK